MKRIAPIILPLCLAATNSWAGLSATVTGATDYVAEGVSQTDNNPALQGSLDYSFDSGIYLGVWASNVDFGRVDDPEDYSSEQDWYAGWTGAITKDVSIDVGYIRYAYSDAPDDADFDDYHVGVTVFENTTVTYHYEDDEDIWGEDTDGDGINDRGGELSWWAIEQTIPLNDDWSAGVIVNYKKNEEVKYGIGDETGDDYTNWNLTLNTKWQGLDLQLLYSDTNIDSEDDTEDTADERLVFSVSRTFDF